MAARLSADHPDYAPTWKRRGMTPPWLNPTPPGPNVKLLPPKEFERTVHVSRAGRYNKQATGDFPPSIRLGPCKTAIRSDWAEATVAMLCMPDADPSSLKQGPNPGGSKPSTSTALRVRANANPAASPREA